MIAIKPITRRNITLLKAVRLLALQDAPYAFSSTYAHESQLTDSEWLARVERMNDERGVGLLAMDAATPCGIAACFLDNHDHARAQLVSMWTAPLHRKQGAGRQLINDIIEWGRTRHARTLLLMVTSNNEGALGFYERLGFAKTGRTEPYPNDPAVIEYEMFRAIP